MRAVAVVQGALTLIAFAMLLLVFARSDMSVALVFENSHSAKPFIYKVAGAWGNHEGSMLMWVTVLAVAGAFFALLSRRTSERTLVAALGAQAALALGFYAFLLIASNPFARLFPAPPDGQGLNPLLQDPGLAFHPPTLYLGYVGLSVAFSLAVGALLTGEVDRRLARAMRPWVLGAWILLTLGITAGSYWAYYELGWGGYWFWDPVENASLMPWLAATALLHSINVLAARGALKAWTMMLAVDRLFDVDGRHLPRPLGHPDLGPRLRDRSRSAAPSCSRCSPSMSARRSSCSRCAARRSKEGAPFELVSRETGLVINNLLLSVILGIVFLGTLYPLVRRGGERREAVGRRALFQRGRGAAGADPRGAGRHRAAAQLAARAAAGLQAADGARAARRRPRWRSRSSSRRRCASCRALGLDRCRVTSPARASCRWSAATRCARRSRPGAWSSRISGSRSRSPAWRRTPPSRSERLAVAKPGETLSVGPWPVQLEGRDADRRARTGRRSRRELRATRGGGVDHAQAADALFHRPADRDQ